MAADLREIQENQWVSEIRIDKLEFVDEEQYSLRDGVQTIGDAIVYTEQCLNDKLAPLEQNEFAYKVQKLYVMQHPSSELCDFNMVIGREYKGTDIVTESDFIPRKEDSYDNSLCGTHFIAVMRYAGQLDYFNVCTELMSIESETKLDKIISLNWAIEKMNQEIAHTDNTSIDNCGLVYIMTQDVGSYDNGEQPFLTRVDDMTYIKPYWIFTSTVSISGFETMTGDMLGETILVDAENGDIYYYLFFGLCLNIIVWLHYML